MSDTQEAERPFFPDVEKLFEEYVEYIGGTVVDKLESNKTDKPNADFLFNHPAIVAELKTFQKDIFSEPEDIPRFIELSEKWISNHLMTRQDFWGYVFRGKPLPQNCIDDLIERASKTIERAVYKANKQIEQTKKTFEKEDAYGIVFLINDGNYFFSNVGFIQIISKLIGRKFKDSSFNVVIYLTINQATYKEDSKLDYNFYVPIYTKIDEDGNTIVSDELHSFVNIFGERFLNEFLTLKTGHSVQDSKQIDNIEEALMEFKKHQFIPKHIIFKK